jgi:hypothetical protein
MSPIRDLPAIPGSMPEQFIASASARATSDTLRSRPEPMLNTSPAAFGACSASAKARATSLTWTKSRRCSPSSKIIGGCPLSRREAKIASTPV